MRSSYGVWAKHVKVAALLCSALLAASCGVGPIGSPGVSPKSSPTGASADPVDPTPTWSNWRITTYVWPTKTQASWSPPLLSPSGGGFLANDAGVWFNFPEFQSLSAAAVGPQVIRLLCYYGQSPQLIGGAPTVPEKFVSGNLIKVAIHVDMDSNASWFWTGDPSVAECGTPPAAHVNLISSLWKWPSFEPWYEWFSVSAVPLSPGDGSVTVSLQDLSDWVDIYGVRADDPSVAGKFDLVLGGIAEAGLSFGGGCAYGHGVSVVGGSARFELTEWKAE